MNVSELIDALQKALNYHGDVLLVDWCDRAVNPAGITIVQGEHTVKRFVEIWPDRVSGRVPSATVSQVVAHLRAMVADDETVADLRVFDSADDPITGIEEGVGPHVLALVS